MFFEVRGGTEQTRGERSEVNCQKLSSLRKNNFGESFSFPFPLLIPSSSGPVPSNNSKVEESEKYSRRRDQTFRLEINISCERRLRPGVRGRGEK